MKRRFGVMAMAAVLSAALAVPAYAGTWKYVNDQWKYQRGANKFAYNEWIQDKGKYYYLDNDGYVTTGWQQIEGQEPWKPAGLKTVTAENGTICIQAV